MLSEKILIRGFLAGAFLMLLLTGTYAASSAHPQQAKIKIGVILPGRINDLAWNQAGYESMLRFQDKFKDQIEIMWVENHDEKAVIQEDVRSYVAKGAKLIIGHGFEFQQPLEELAPQFPDVSFLVVAGFKKLPNLSIADVRTDQTGYILGWLAGKMTKNNKLGYVMGLRVAELGRFEPNFAKGAHDANPNIFYDYGNVSSIIPGQKGIKPGGSISVVEIGDFHAVDKAKQAAAAMAAQGVDVIATMGDGVVLGTIQGAIDANVFLIGNGVDITTAPVKGAEKLVLASGSWHWDAIFGEWFNDVKSGKRGNSEYWSTMQNGGLKIDGPSAIVPSDTANGVKDLVPKVTGGQITTDQCLPSCRDAKAVAPTAAGGTDVTTIGTVVVIVIILAIAAVILRRRKPKKTA